MALTLAEVARTSNGNLRGVIVDVTFDSSYPTNGESLAPLDLGLVTISKVLLASPSGYTLAFDYVNNKIKVFNPTKAQSPTFTGSALAGHTHTFTGSALAGHTHTFTGSALAGHVHTFTGSALAGHTHTFTGSALPGHTHTFTGSALGTHVHVFTGSALAGHTHTFTGSALAGHTHTFTGSALAGHTHTLTTKVIRLTHAVSDLKGSANTNSENVDAGALPTNGTAVAAYATVAAGVWAHGALTNPDVGRNVCVVIRNNTGGALNLFEGVMTFTVTGTRNGAATTDTITFTSTAGNKSVAAAQFRYKYGTVAFDTVTDLTLDNVPANALDIAAGLGSKIFLPTVLATPAEADVTKLSKNAVHLSPSGIVDTTNNTVNFGALTDGDDVMAVYSVGALGTALSSDTAGTPAGTLDSVTGGTPAGTLDSVTGGTPAGTLDAVSGGTPAGTLDSVTGGTPAGTLDSVTGGTPAGTLDSVSGGTPAGTLDSVSGGTPAGTNASVSAGTPAGTISAISASAGTEVANGTNLATLATRLWVIGT